MSDRIFFWSAMSSILNYSRLRAI